MAHEIRGVAEGIEPDPERLTEIRTRRKLLRDLCRKYGESLQEVMSEADALRRRHEELHGYEDRAAALLSRREDAATELRTAQRIVREQRRHAAPDLADAVQAHLADLALAKARIHIDVGGAPTAGTPRAAGSGSSAQNPGSEDRQSSGSKDGQSSAPEDGQTSDPQDGQTSGPADGRAGGGDLAGDNVTFLLAANPGSPLLPLAKVASGGELARAMLALRLVLSTVGYNSPPTQIFDEVDAGIGGAAATAVGQALARLAAGDRQIIVVTHLPQVAAWATTQVTVEKRQEQDSTASAARVVTDKERSVELARMLSGSPHSRSARKHATELLHTAAALRATWVDPLESPNPSGAIRSQRSPG